MKTYSAREIFGVFVALVVALFSLGAWGSFSVVAIYPDLWNTLQALFWFSLVGSCFLLGTVVWRTLLTQVIGVLSLFLPSFLFTQTWYHLGFVVSASFAAWWGIRLVQEEMIDRLNFHFFKNVRAGSFALVFGLSLALSSAYFSSIKTATWEELVPRFNVGEGTATGIFKTVAYLYPEWKNLADEGMTVDGFLSSLKKGEAVEGETGLENDASLLAIAEYLKQNGIEPGSLPAGELEQELALQAGREQIAALAGRPVRGDEKIADVFSLALQHRIITLLSGEQASRHLSPVIVPFILTILLFLTLLPIGSALTLLWMVFSFLIFHIALSFGWLRLDRLPKEQEVLLP